MSSAPIYVKGDWLAICDVCGRQYKASYLRKRWDGLMVCNDDYEQRHPQDFVRGVKETQVVPWSRDEVQDTFVHSDSSTSIAMFAISGDMIAGNTNNPGVIPPSTFTI